MKRTHHRWTKEEDTLLIEVVQQAEKEGKSRMSAYELFAASHENVTVSAAATHYIDLTSSTRRKPVTEPKKRGPRSENISGLNQLVEYVKSLQKQVASLEKRIKVYEQMEKDYEDFTRVLRHARDSVIPPVTKTSFKMDQNGNLERVK